MPRENTTVPLSTRLVIGQTRSQYTQGYIHTLNNRPNISPIPFTILRSGKVHAKISDERETGKMLEVHLYQQGHYCFYQVITSHTYTVSRLLSKTWQCL